MRVLLIRPPPGGGTSRLRIGEEPARLWIALLEWNECFSFVPQAPSVFCFAKPTSLSEGGSIAPHCAAKTFFSRAIRESPLQARRVVRL